MTLGVLYSGCCRTLGVLGGEWGRGEWGAAIRLVALTPDWSVGVSIVDSLTYVGRWMSSNY